MVMEALEEQTLLFKLTVHIYLRKLNNLSMLCGKHVELLVYNFSEISTCNFFHVHMYFPK